MTDEIILYIMYKSTHNNSIIVIMDRSFSKPKYDVEKTIVIRTTL